MVGANSVRTIIRRFCANTTFGYLYVASDIVTTTTPLKRFSNPSYLNWSGGHMRNPQAGWDDNLWIYQVPLQSAPQRHDNGLGQPTVVFERKADSPLTWGGAKARKVDSDPCAEWNPCETRPMIKINLERLRTTRHVLRHVRQLSCSLLTIAMSVNLTSQNLTKTNLRVPSHYKKLNLISFGGSFSKR